MHFKHGLLLIGLLPAAGLIVGPALAQDASTTVPKAAPAAPATPAAPTTPATGPVPTAGGTMKPAQDVAPGGDDSYDAAAPGPGELNSNGSDEGAGWDAAIEAAPAPTPLIGADEDAALQRINGYFNGITSLQGNFDQVDANNKHTTGRFYVQRPGKLRFDYAPPSSLRLVSDGHFLSIEDSDLKTIEKYPIESTPFRLLLGDGVDLGHDARVVGVESQENTLAITLEDKSGQSSGQIKLFFDTQPEMKLKEWIITDAQGLSTTVTVTDLAPGRKFAADFFNATVSFSPFQ